MEFHPSLESLLDSLDFLLPREGWSPRNEVALGIHYNVFNPIILKPEMIVAEREGA